MKWSIAAFVLEGECTCWLGFRRVGPFCADPASVLRKRCDPSNTKFRIILSVTEESSKELLATIAAYSE